MNSKKKWLIGVLVAVINTALILAYVGYRYYEYSKAEELVMAYELQLFQIFLLTILMFQNWHKKKLWRLLKKNLEILDKKNDCRGGDQTFERSLEDFNVTFNQDIESFSKKSSKLGKI